MNHNKSDEEEEQVITIDTIKPFFVDPNRFRIAQPFRLQISGTTGSGKSTLIGNLLRFRDQLFSEKFARVIYCYPFADKSVYTKDSIALFKQYYEGLYEHDGLPIIEDLGIQGRKDHTLCILDDMSSKVFKSPQMAHLFSNVSSHEKISVILVTQNPFCAEKHRRGKKKSQTTSLTYF